VASQIEHKEMAGPKIEPETEERMVIRSSALPADIVPSSILIAPWGEVESANGKFFVDAESAELALAAFGQHGTDLPVDYEHQSLGGVYSSPNGQAPAAGWIRALRAVRPCEDGDGEPGLFADVEWTEAARAKLAAKEYRYLSPVVIVRKRDRRLVALHSAALTNKPAIVGMKPIVNREGSEASADEDSEADFQADAEGHAASTVLVAKEAVEKLRDRLGMNADSDIEAVLCAVDDRLSELMNEIQNRDAGERVDRAMQSGKLSPSQREWAFSFALKDPHGFDQWSASVPAVVMMGRTEVPEGRGTCSGRDRTAVIASARTTFRTHPELALLTSESAWVADALREADLCTEIQTDGR